MNLKNIPKTSKWLKKNYLEILREIESESVKKKLDVGCGRGEITKALANCFGIDVKKYPEWESDREKFSIYDGINPPNKKFDTIILNNSYEHVPKKTTLIQNLKKLNKKAKIIIVLPTTKYLLSRYALIPQAIISKLIGKPQGIHLYLVHEPSIYGWNFFKEYLLYSNWEKELEKYFKIQSKKIFDDGKQFFFICEFK